MNVRTITVALLALFVTASHAHAAQTAEGCRAAKIKATASAAVSKLKCYAYAAKKGVAVDPECLSDVDTKFGVVFVRIESRGACSPTGDASVYLNDLNDFVSDISGGGNCAAKTNAAGAGARSLLKCYAKAIKKGEDADSKCLDKAEEKLVAAFDKADAKGCVPTGGASTAQTQVDGFVSQVVGVTKIILFEVPQAPGSLGSRVTTTATCASVAAANSLSCNTTVAMLSYTGDAVREFPTNYGLPTGLPIVANGQTIANNWADFLDGTWATCLGSSCTPAGPTGAGFTANTTIWTGTNPDGTIAENCNNWTIGNGTAVGARPWYISCYGQADGGAGCPAGATLSQPATATSCQYYYSFACFCY